MCHDANMVHAMCYVYYNPASKHIQSRDSCSFKQQCINNASIKKYVPRAMQVLNSGSVSKTLGLHAISQALSHTTRFSVRWYIRECMLITTVARDNHCRQRSTFVSGVAGVGNAVARPIDMSDESGAVTCTVIPPHVRRAPLLPTAWRWEAPPAQPSSRHKITII